MTKKFLTPYQSIKSTVEKNNGKRLIEVAGYIPAQKRIENIINAGQRLIEVRQDQYDFANGDRIPDGWVDPTRRRNYDMADAFQEAQYLRFRAAERKKALEESKASEKAEKVEDTKKAENDKEQVD